MKLRELLCRLMCECIMIPLQNGYVVYIQALNHACTHACARTPLGVDLDVNLHSPASCSMSSSLSSAETPPRGPRLPPIDSSACRVQCLLRRTPLLLHLQCCQRLLSLCYSLWNNSSLSLFLLFPFVVQFGLGTSTTSLPFSLFFSHCYMLKGKSSLFRRGLRDFLQQLGYLRQVLDIAISYCVLLSCMILLQEKHLRGLALPFSEDHCASSPFAR